MKENKIQPHLRITEVSEFCLISGNPDRVPIIASNLKESQKVASNRGLVSYTGKTPNFNVSVSVLTTGMGSPSTAIILEEAYRAGGRVFIRIGSCGALKLDMKIGDVVIPYAAIRDEGTSLNFAPLAFPAVASPEIYERLSHSARKLKTDFHSGIVWTTDIYYSTVKDQYKTWAKCGANTVEMESALLFVFGIAKNVKTGSILVVDGNLAEGTQKDEGVNSEIDDKFRQGVQKSIECAIAAIELLWSDNPPNQ
ncbi:MAG: nucleoside phosphorylase [Candidatus Thorarchaeota archaeon]